MKQSWEKEVAIGVTVCDKEGIVLDMNDKACKIFEKSGGAELIGKNLYDCHSEASKNKLKQMMEHSESNIYTIEKNGIKKMIVQLPWTVEKEFKGFVELSIELPNDMPHFIRK